MNKTIILTFLSFILINQSFSKTAINIEWKGQLNSNMNLQTKDVEENIFATGLKASTKFKAKIKKRMYLITLPSIDALMASSSEESLREYNLNNTFIGLYLPSRKHIFTISSTQGYSKSASLDGEDQLQKNKYAHINLDGGYQFNINKNFKVNTTVGTKLQEYFTQADIKSELHEENDNWKQFVNLKGTYFINKVLSFFVITSAENKIFKEKRALTKTGKTGGVEAETLRKYKGGVGVNLKGSFINSGAKFDSIINEDQVHGGRDYDGKNYSVHSGFNYKGLSYLIKGSYKTKDYLSYKTDSEELYRTKSYTLINKIALPLSWTYGYNTEVEHKLIKLRTNQTDEDFDNQVIQLAFKFTY